jgi:methyltransferase (TIGR00027 family)
MINETPSKTALGVVKIRASHLLLDKIPPILNDTISLKLINASEIERINRNAELLNTPSMKARRSMILIRSRIAEDSLEHSGIKQFINLGAGYDTFAYRQPSWAKDLTIVEADHLDTQNEKIKLLNDKRIKVPENVSYLPIDLENDQLIEKISNSRIDSAEPAFIACLGVLVYLNHESVKSIFNSFSKLPEGSKMIFTYSSPKENNRIKGNLEEQVEKIGEPWKTRMGFEEIKGILKGMGIYKIVNYSAEEIRKKYYVERTDLSAPQKSFICEIER